MGIQVEPGAPVNLTISGAISLRPGHLIGFYVNSTNAGTLIIRNGGSAGAAISGTITPAIGFHRYPAYITSDSGAYAEIGGTALNVTFIFQAG